MEHERRPQGGKEAEYRGGKAPVVGSFDGLHGPLARGWVWDPDAPDERATVEFLIDDQVIHTAEASLFRHDLQASWIGNGWVGFETSLPFEPGVSSAAVHARLKGTPHALANSPQTPLLHKDLQRWMTRRERVSGAFLERLRSRLDRSVGDALLSIVLCVHDTRAEWLDEALDSVLGQWCSRWELICVDNASSAPHVRSTLADYARRSPRVRIIRLDTQVGSSAAMNAGLSAVTGDYIAVISPEDAIEPDAAYHLLRAARSGAELIYTDELLTGEQLGIVVSAQVRPAFSWDYYLCHPYFRNIVCVRTDIARSVGGWHAASGVAASLDYVLRVIEQSRLVAHVPAVLYRRRMRETSVDRCSAEADVACVRTLNAHLARVSPGAIARPTRSPDQYRIDFPDEHGAVLIVIPTKNRLDLLRPCVESIRASTPPDEVRICIIDHESDDPETCQYIDSRRGDCEIFEYHGEFNYARMNNLAVAQHGKLHGELPPYILFANNDLEVMHEGWLQRMRSLAARPDIGVVGATLLYANGTVQHSGVVMGPDGGAAHAHRSLRFISPEGERERGYLSTLVSTREYSAVTAACIMMRSEVFAAVDGFDERFVVGFNDTDLCLRIGELGLKIINDGATVLHHYESATRSLTKQLSHPEDDKLLQSRWGKIIRGNDPFYSRLFSDRSPDHRIARFTALPVVPRVRPGLAPATRPPAPSLLRPLRSLLGRSWRRKSGKP